MVVSGQSISFTYPQLFRPLIQEASFDIALTGRPPDKIGFIGPNGHGKNNPDPADLGRDHS